MLAAAPSTRAWFPMVDELQVARPLTDEIVAGEFTFNGERHALGRRPDWMTNPSSDVEWLILLHKFYYATGLGMAWRETGDSRYLRCWVELTESWIASVPVDFLSSDVAGRRIQNWLSAWHYFEESAQLPAGFRARFLHSIEEQVEWLATNLTPARNHRTLELLTLFFAGVALPELPNASRWLEFARVELARNVAADFRPDGVHCEQSTDYHHIVLRNALVARRLAELNGIEMPEGFDDSLRRALDFARWIHRPDGLIPSLSDGDTASFLPLLREGYEIFGDPRYLWVATQGREGEAPTETQAAFPDGGYYIWRSGWGTRERFADERFLVFDCGPLGDGNHGHLDWLSFELYGNGQPLILDPGRYTYAENTTPNWRVLFRGAGYHNTVTVDGMQPVRYEERKGKHKVRGEHPRFEMTGLGQGAFRGRLTSCEYDAVHEREIRVLDSRNFLVTDVLSSASEHRYDLWFHLAPVAEGRVETRDGRVIAPGLRILQAAGAASLSLEGGWISPVYGIKKAAPIVRYSATGKNFTFETHIEVLS